MKRSPFDQQLVARYKQLLKKNPDDSFALHKLIALYKSYRTLDQLAAEYVKSHDWADLMVLGHLQRERSDHAGAAKWYEQALSARAGEPRSESALADEYVLLKRAGEARPLYQAALEATSELARKRPLLRKLAELALAPDRGLPAKEAVAEARRSFDALLAQTPNDDDTRRELAEALASHGAPKEAAGEWQKIVEHLGKDPAAQTRGWLRIGELDEQATDDGAARAAYDRAYKLAPKGNYLQREAIDKIIGVSRRKDQLRTLVAGWEKEWGRSFVELETLARLYDELGDAARAQEYFKKALAIDGHALEARRRLIALYEREGKDVEVIAEYRKLIAAAPGEPRFRLELAERLWKSTDPALAKEAVAMAERLGTDTRDPSVHSTLAELFQRWGLSDRALAEREKLVRLEPNEESHLVNLGELYFQRGKKDKALESWRKLLLGGTKKEQAMARLAEVYAEHDLPGEALELYQKAAKLAPTDAQLKKGLASAFERMHRDQEADLAWQEAFELAVEQKQRALALEIRQRLLASDLRSGRLAARLGIYRARFTAATDEGALAAWGLLTVDGYLKLGRAQEALDLLDKLNTRAKTPEVKADASVAAAQVLRTRHDLKGAIAALEKAAELAPSRARELYSQIAELSLMLYRDADALTYAKKAIELGPSDAHAQLRLAEVYEKRDQIDEAVAAYERALELNDRLWKVHFVLARLELRSGEYAKAARLYRDVIRRAPEEELVIDAARRAIDLEEYLGTLGELERELSPLSYAHPEKRVYRNLLVDLFERYAGPLIPRARRGDVAARKELTRLGEHGLRPLLDVLVTEGGGDPAQQKQAVMLLGELGNASAAEPLLKLASQPRRLSKSELRDPLRGIPGGTLGGMVIGTRPIATPVVDLRVEAAIAGARLASGRELPVLLKLAEDPEKYLRTAALYGLGRLGGTGAENGLVKALGDNAGEVQAMACLGLARLTSASARSAGEMTRLLKERSKPDVARAACAYGLGVLAPRLAEGVQTSVRAALVDTLEEGADDLHEKAAWALGQLGARKAAAPLLAAVFTKRDEVRRVALAALEPHSSQTPLLGEPARGADGLDVRGWVAELDCPGRDQAPPSSWRGLETEVAAAITEALGRHRDLVLRALADLDARDDGLALGPLTAGKLEPQDRAAVDDVGSRLLPAVARLTQHADPLVRARAVHVMAKLRDGLPRMLQALADPALEVRLSAISALGSANAQAADVGKSIPRALDQALRARDWRERRAAVTVLPDSFPPGELGLVTSALGTALDDGNGFVREAAARALGSACAAHKSVCDGVVTVLARHGADEAADVRAQVALSLGQSPSPAARAALDKLARDPDPAVRAAVAHARAH